MPTGTGAATLGLLTSTATGRMNPVGTSAVTLAALTSTATGRMNPVGTSAASLLAATSTASGSTVKGTSAATLLAATSTASGGSTAGTSAVTLATIVSASTGTSAGGSSAVTLSALTGTASGVRGASGTSAATLNSATSTATGQVTIFGAVATLLDALTSLATNAALPVTINFEDGTIPTALLWSGDPGTVVDRPDAGGTTLKALQFRDIGDNEETTFELYAVAHAPGSATLTVRYEVSSEEGYDFFRVIVDDVDVLGDPDEDPGDEEGRSGITGGFLTVSVSLSEGEHSLRFGYYKDSSADDGDDTAWIASITYPAGTRPVLAASILDDLTGEATAAVDPDIPEHYRFWRIRIDEPNGNFGGVDVQELELRGELGGPDLTDTLPGVVTSLNQFYVPDFRAEDDGYKAYDNNSGTYWNSVISSFGYVDFEFTTYPQYIKQIQITAPYNDGPKELYVAASLDGNFYFDYKGIFNGETEWSTADDGIRTFDLVGLNRRYDANLGRDSWAFFSPVQDFCDADHISVAKATVATIAGIYKMVANTSVQMPYNPYPLPVTHTSFKIRGVIYDDDGVGGKPGTLLAVTNERTETAGPDPYKLGNWFDLWFDEPVFLRPGSYYLGVQVGGDQSLSSSKTSNFGENYTVAAAYGSGVPASFPGGETVVLQQYPVYGVYPVSTSFVTLDALTSTAIGTFGVSAITGTAELILEALTSDAAGIYYTPVTGTAAALLDSLTSDAAGARGVFRPRVSLHGTDRPQRTLNATWVPR